MNNIQFFNNGFNSPFPQSTTIKENEKDYPENRMFGDNLPAYGFYLRHVKNISLQQIQFNISGEEHRPALHIEDAENISINTCKIKIPANNQPVVRIIDTKGLLLSNLYDTQSPIPLLLETDGKNTGKIRIMNQEGGKGDNLVKSK